MTYITVASVRRTCGIGSSEISDADVTSTIAEVEAQVPRYFNTVFTPTELIETRDGNGTNRLVLKQNPVLAVRDLYIDGTQEGAENLHVYKGSGKIVLNTSASTSTFIRKQNAITINYIYGMMEESSTSSTTSEAEEAGTSVSIALASITGFADEDWVEIYGMDGFREVAQINATPAGGAIVVDQLIQTHVAGSKVVKLQISENFKKLMNLIASIALVARIVGESYTDTVGYSLGALQVQKGEPYTQWRETAIQFIRERDELMNRIKIRPYIA
ncbi:hypothetical protein LCGC14_1937240 [marine sediment metagenome]|uniref:Uncharacterized protein n=1 Tax=marine sediment metagenome TaxID=412755 RepID=A0A0F9HZV5_9ZZZZ